MEKNESQKITKDLNRSKDFFWTKSFSTSNQPLQKNEATMTSYRIVLLFAFICVVVGFDLAAIKPRFPKQFTATISDTQGYSSYLCLFDSINKREKCQLNDNVYRIRNFSTDTFTETNYTTEFPSKCNISANINDAKLLDPDWFDKLNLSLVSTSKDSVVLYTWMFTLKKPSLLEELPFVPKLIPRVGG